MKFLIISDAGCNLSSSNNDWLVPKCVSNPKLIEDIGKYIKNDFNECYFDKLSDKVKGKLAVLIDRIELIEHLHFAGLYICKDEKKNITSEKKDEKHIIVTTTLSNEIDGHDFAGFGFDVEALIFYLFATCIDIIMSQPDYKNPFDWLLEEHQGSLSGLNLDNIKKEYSDVYGLNKNFILAFEKFVNEEKEIRQCWLDCVKVVKVQNQMIVGESLKRFERLEDCSKLRKIASKIYDLRSKFTHAGARQFFPSELVEESLINGEVLLVKKDKSIYELMLSTIRYLSSKKLLTLTSTQ